MTPSSLGAAAAVGALWRGSSNQSVNAETRPFLEMDVLYGDLTTKRPDFLDPALWLLRLDSNQQPSG
jgi:hypothetical protein